MRGGRSNWERLREVSSGLVEEFSHGLWSGKYVIVGFMKWKVGLKRLVGVMSCVVGFEPHKV